MSDLSLYWIPLLPLLGAAFNLLVGRMLPRRVVHAVAVSAVGLAFVVVAAKVFGPLWHAWHAWYDAGRTGAAPALHETVYTWLQTGALRVDIAFTLDALSAVMVVLITFVGTLIHIYSTGYMAHEPRYAAYFGYLNLFTGAMLILVLGDSLPVMFIGWEGVGLCSYLLIGFWFEKEANAYAGRKAFVVNRVGDFAFLLGMFLIYWQVRTLSFADINANASAFGGELVWGGSVAFFACTLLFIGACGKSAQIPLYVWLPDAMAGPTPVSALIHAATMVTAGVYMVARLSFLFATTPGAMAIVAGVGALTALVAAVIAFAQTDFKKVLAYSTVSQLGFMFVGVGAGAHAAGVFHLLSHGFFKAGLFLAAGSVMHAMSGSGDITKMGGLRKKLPWTHLAFVAYWLAICGVPPLAGFFSKDEILAGAFGAHVAGWPAWYGKLLWAVLTAAAVGTAFYMSRLYFLVFAGECRADEHTRAHIHESPPSMTVPLLVLAGFTAVLGALWFPHALQPPWLQIYEWLEPATSQAHVGHVSTSTGFGLMGLATALALAGIFAARALYGRGPSAVVDRWTAAGLGALLWRWVRDKLYVDELYDAVIVRPFRAASEFLFEVVDRFVIDTLLVTGAATAIDLAGRAVRAIQNGYVQRYLVAVLLGAAAIFYLTNRGEADFRYRAVGPYTVEFEADVGTGPAAQSARIEWDFDGDGAADADGARVTHPFPAANSYPITMWFTDGVFGTTRRVDKTVDVQEAP
ncbi:MAG: NADH-quinone oxidoreductase subunit L [Deltaproteobacteria bacterium]|nr:MAG: NADH-quinone oxidoreductase subunit L [Deltaproteobacteria bacterium]